MKTCPMCNKELSDDMKFCDSCGTEIFETIFCQSCGQQTSTQYAFCQNCGASLAETPAETPVAEEPAPKKKLPTKGILFGVIGVAVIAVLIFVGSLIFGGKAQNNYALYLKDMELYYNDLGKNSESWQVSDKLLRDGDLEEKVLADTGSYFAYRLVQLSEDGKRIFYPEKIDMEKEGFTLNYRSTKDPDAEGTKVDSDVHEYYINSAGTVVTYIKGDDRNLYQGDLKKDDEPEKIAKDVDNFWLSEDGSTILFRDTDNNLYLKETGKEKEKIASEITSLEYRSEDFETIYYTKDGALYKQVKGEDKEKIASDVHDVLRIYESGELYYLTKEAGEVSLADYVNDDLKSADENLTEPDYPTYPEYPAYPTYPKEPNYPYWWNYDTTAEYEAAYAAYEAEYEAWQEACDRLDEEYSDACDEWEEEYNRIDEEYNAAREAYWAKENRDELRASLAEWTLEQSVYALHYYDGSEETVLTESLAGGYYDYYDYTAAYDAAVIAYEAYNQSSIEKVKLSEISSIYELESMVETALYSSTEYYIAVKAAATVIEAEEEIYRVEINDDGTLVYYLDEMDEEGRYGELYSMTIKNGKVGEAKLSDSDVYYTYCYFLENGSFRYYKEVKDIAEYEYQGELYIDGEKVDDDVHLSSTMEYPDQNKIFYFVDFDAEESCGTLKVYDGEKSVEIDDDVYEYSVRSNADQKKFYYFTEWDAEKSYGTLKVYNGKESEVIGEEVHTFVVLPDERVLYLYDYSMKSYKGELHEWDDGKTRKIDDDVIAIIPVVSVSDLFY